MSPILGSVWSPHERTLRTAPGSRTSAAPAIPQAGPRRLNLLYDMAPSSYHTHATEGRTRVSQPFPAISSTSIGWTRKHSKPRTIKRCAYSVQPAVQPPSADPHILSARLVLVQEDDATDASAEDFWKRVRKSEDVSPVNFHILTHAERIQRSTPYGRQQRPHLPATVASALRTSRSIERVELRAAIREGEDDKENLERAVRENETLKRQIEHLVQTDELLGLRRDKLFRQYFYVCMGNPLVMDLFAITTNCSGFAAALIYKLFNVDEEQDHILNNPNETRDLTLTQSVLTDLQDACSRNNLPIPNRAGRHTKARKSTRLRWHGCSA